jgi:tRNA(fMet)-specific endonuclease VapC
MVIDTNIFIEHLRAKQKSTTKLVQLLNDGNRLFISSVTVYELYSGAITPEKANRVHYLIEDIPVLTFNYDIALKAAQIFRQLKAKNQLIEFRDIFIAATCINEGLPIVTLNRKHFERIEALQII